VTLSDASYDRRREKLNADDADFERRFRRCKAQRGLLEKQPRSLICGIAVTDLRHLR